MSLLLGSVVATFLIAIPIGFRFGRTWWRFYALIAAGFASQIIVGAILLVHAPTGSGWYDRSQVLGHWIPTDQLDADLLALLPWMVGLAAGMFTRLVTRTQASQDAKS